MAIQDLVSPGIGFNPGSVEFIITRGLGVSETSDEAGMIELDLEINQVCAFVG